MQEMLIYIAAGAGVLAAVLSLIGLIFVLRLRSGNVNVRELLEQGARSNREEIKLIGTMTVERLSASAEMQNKQMESFAKQIAALSSSTNESIHRMASLVDAKLKDLREDNNQKLEKMRETVDEKLQKTLNTRLGESFRQVSEQLEKVYKGLGEMQTIAANVGDLKKVLSNVKTRGILGEIQLESILTQILSPEQFAKNIATKRDSRDVVEFAVKMPGPGDDPVYLPIDSKFPMDVYNGLITAYENGDAGAIDEASKLLEKSIRDNARLIHQKYIDPPNTTDFAIMFLPTEGLFAEVARRPSLLETLSRDYQINVAGPTTLAAFLNSLRMGFRTLAIEKRSGEVWQVLGSVKTEFLKFDGVLKSAQTRLTQANEDIDKLVGTRTRQIIRKMQDVSELPANAGELGVRNDELGTGDGENM